MSFLQWLLLNPDPLARCLARSRLRPLPARLHPWEVPSGKMPVNNTALPLSSITYITVEILIGLCSIVGNVLVILVIKLNPSLQTTTFYFIISLALADIAVGYW